MYMIVLQPDAVHTKTSGAQSLAQTVQCCLAHIHPGLAMPAPGPGGGAAPAAAPSEEDRYLATHGLTTDAAVRLGRCIVVSET
jgi:hypothetical protein